MKTLLVSGYSAYDLGIFNDQDPRVTVIRAAFREQLTALLDDGLEWLVFTGALGFESWALVEARQLQQTHDFQLATIFDFATHGQNWNAANQAKLTAFKNVDFVKYVYPAYQSPQQLRLYQQFLLDNSDGALIFYDPSQPTRLEHLVAAMQAQPDYELTLLDFERLQDFAEDFDNAQDEANFDEADPDAYFQKLSQLTKADILAQLGSAAQSLPKNWSKEELLNYIKETYLSD